MQNFVSVQKKVISKNYFDKKIIKGKYDLMKYNIIRNINYFFKIFVKISVKFCVFNFKNQYEY